MKKSVWIFLFAVLLPSVVLGWLALRSAEEQQIVFERRTAELYQKETEALAATVRDTVEAERRVFGETVRRLLAKSDADALARDFTNTLADAWPVKAVGFAISKEGRLLSPSAAMAAKQPEIQRFMRGNGSFLTSTEPAIVYNWAGNNDTRNKGDYGRTKQVANISNSYSFSNSGSLAGKDALQTAQQTVGFKEGTTQRQVPMETRSKADELAAFKSPEMKRKESDAEPARATAKPAPKIAAGGPPPVTATPVLTALEANPPGFQLDKAKVAEPMPMAADEPSKAQAPGVLTGGGLRVDTARVGTKPDAIADRDGGSAGVTMKKSGTAASSTLAAMKPEAGKSRDDVKENEESQFRRLQAGTKPAAEPQPEKFNNAPSAPPPMPVAPVPQTSAAANPQGVAVPNVDALRSSVSGSLEAGEQAFDDANASGAVLAMNSTAQGRMVEPQQLLGQQNAAVSTLMPETAEFRSLCESAEEGLVARFAQDKLNLIFWLRPPEAPETVFGCLVEAGHFSGVWKDVLERHRASSSGSQGVLDSKPEFVLALLDDRGKPAAAEPADAGVRDWKRPFVASEIGEMLPHWEAALYLASPTALAESARGLWRTLAFTIAGAVALIAFGGWLVVADARRQLALAQQKTDFVSNVSHELKTPLTSIRMFAELMHDRPQPAEKQSQYLRIITVEAERLTRLINNVLDFAKIGRKQKRTEKKPLDLYTVVARVWESQELHLREAGFTTRWEAAPGPYPVLGDEDALAQVLVNLLSNAEKYSTERKEVELHTWLDDGHVEIAVMERGMGVPSGDDRKIFEAFYRAHDSLNSGIQGSGLGLTLALRVAREHSGEIRFERREGGGCRFTLRLPLAEKLRVEG